MHTPVLLSGVKSDVGAAIVHELHHHACASTFVVYAITHSETCAILTHVVLDTGTIGLRRLLLMGLHREYLRLQLGDGVRLLLHQAVQQRGIAGGAGVRRPRQSSALVAGGAGGALARRGSASVGRTRVECST